MNLPSVRLLSLLPILLFPLIVSASPDAAATDPANPPPISVETIRAAETLLGLEFTPEERELMLDSVASRRKAYAEIRNFPLAPATAPALRFLPAPPSQANNPAEAATSQWSDPGPVSLPVDPEEIAFYSIPQLADLIRSRQITSEQLTRLYLERLKRYDGDLFCVITLTEELALAQARRADREIAAGRYRGLLHGIPYGVKDLLATKGIPTTWGSPAYRDQIFEENAVVVDRLEAAGAVLVAKLSLGELAWGNTWFGGDTRNPWKTSTGSSGSSAGPAAATAAGLVAFSIGSETRGSILYPAGTCGVTGFRPTYGRVSAVGAMPLAWSMDKIGPIARTSEDCAIIFEAIHGPHDRDPWVADAPFSYHPRTSLAGLRIGFLKNAFEAAKQHSDLNASVMETLADLGAELVPVSLPANYPISSLSFILSTESAAVFDELTRSNRDDLMVRQIANAWPNVFRANRFVPAVEFIQANRIRQLLIHEMETLFRDIDLFLAPTFEGENLLLTNLTGHPAVVVPTGIKPDGLPASITFVGNLYDDATLLAVAQLFQTSTGHHLKTPPAFTPAKVAIKE